MLDNRIVPYVIDQSYLQRIAWAGRKKELIARHIIAQNIVRSPAAEQREAWTQLDVHRVVFREHIRRRNIADQVAIVDIARRCWKNGLKWNILKERS